MIPYARQSISDEDVEAVTRVLRSDFLTQGPEVATFESAVAKVCGAQHALAVSNGTAALHLACQAMGLGKGDWLWTSPITFVASANCGLYCGAQVDFVDIDRETNNLSVKALAEKLAKAETEGRLPKIVVVVHLAGLSCDMIEIRRLADRYKFFVLEDASHALGAQYHGEPVGSCKWSDAAVFSFHAVKIITTGEGGMVVTNNSQLAADVNLLRTHGITKQPDLMTEPSHGPWYYQQLDLGMNCRLTDLQAALGASQLKRLPALQAARVKTADLYDRLLADLPITLPPRSPHASSSWHLYIIRLQTDRIKKSHRAVFEEMQSRGIGVQLHYIPVYLQPFYQKMGFVPAHFPEAQAYYGEAFSLPLYPALKEKDAKYVAEQLRGILAA